MVIPGGVAVPISVNLGRLVPVPDVPNPVVRPQKVAGAVLSDWPYPVQVNPGASTLRVVLVEVEALGTLLQQIEISRLEVPSHAKLEEDPAPVPKLSVFTPDVGKKPSFVSVPR